MSKPSFHRSHLSVMPDTVTRFSSLPSSESVQPDKQPFLQLLYMIAARLHIAHQVALSKWDSNKPVEDAPREADVIGVATEQACALGVPVEFAAHFFSDQIEANKLVQYGLLARWNSEGHAPQDKRADLTHDIRPELDRLQRGFINILAETRDLRLRPDCNEQLSLAIQDYLARHALDPLYAVAMGRALAHACG